MKKIVDLSNKDQIKQIKTSKGDAFVLSNITTTTSDGNGFRSVIGNAIGNILYNNLEIDKLSNNPVINDTCIEFIEEITNEMIKKIHAIEEDLGYIFIINDIFEKEDDSDIPTSYLTTKIGLLIFISLIEKLFEKFNYNSTISLYFLSDASFFYAPSFKELKEYIMHKAPVVITKSDKLELQSQIDKNILKIFREIALNLAGTDYTNFIKRRGLNKSFIFYMGDFPFSKIDNKNGISLYFNDEILKWDSGLERISSLYLVDTEIGPDNLEDFNIFRGEELKLLINFLKKSNFSFHFIIPSHSNIGDFIYNYERMFERTREELKGFIVAKESEMTGYKWILNNIALKTTFFEILTSRVLINEAITSLLYGSYNLCFFKTTSLRDAKYMLHKTIKMIIDLLDIDDLEGE